MELSLILQYLMGSAAVGTLASVLTLRATRRKADAQAKTAELDNVQEAVKIWRELAESFKVELDKANADNCEINKQIELLRQEIARLTSVTRRVLKLLDKITPENIKETIDEIKGEIHSDPA